VWRSGGGIEWAADPDPGGAFAAGDVPEAIVAGGRGVVVVGDDGRNAAAWIGPNGG